MILKRYGKLYELRDTGAGWDVLIDDVWHQRRETYADALNWAKTYSDKHAKWYQLRWWPLRKPQGVSSR